jgi:hypothetical protein
MDLKGRGILILALVVIGAVLASAVTEVFDQEPPLKHHVKAGKVGTNPDGTVWVAEFIKDTVVFNYTLPASSVHSRYVYYSSISIVAVPKYSQDFELERTEDGQYIVYYPSFKASIPVNSLESFVEGKEGTDLVKVYGLFAQSVSDIRVLSKIHESTFSINGIVTMIHRDRSTSIDGYVLTADNKHYMVMLDGKHQRVVSFTEIDFEYK